jgi:hypothetical protein
MNSEQAMESLENLKQDFLMINSGLSGSQSLYSIFETASDYPKQIPIRIVLVIRLKEAY